MFTSLEVGAYLDNSSDVSPLPTPTPSKVTTSPISCVSLRATAGMKRIYCNLSSPCLYEFSRLSFEAVGKEICWFFKICQLWKNILVDKCYIVYCKLQNIVLFKSSVSLLIFLSGYSVYYWKWGIEVSHYYCIAVYFFLQFCQCLLYIFRCFDIVCVYL